MECSCDASVDVYDTVGRIVKKEVSQQHDRLEWR